MKQHILLFFLVCISLQTMKAQDLFIVGKKSYPCTPTFTLKTNSFTGFKDLYVLIAKDGTSGLIVVSVRNMSGVFIRGDLTIYLDDGTVVTCIDRGKYDQVNDMVTTIFYLTESELEIMKHVNINTIRYKLKCRSELCYSAEEGNFSASNIIGNEIFTMEENNDVPYLIKKLFDY